MKHVCLQGEINPWYEEKKILSDGCHGEDLLSVDDPRFGCDKGSQQSLDAALPAPKGGVVGL